MGVLGHRAASTGARDGEVGTASEFGDGGGGRSDRVAAEAAERGAGAGGEEAWARASVGGGLGRGGPALGRAGGRRREADGATWQRATGCGRRREGIFRVRGERRPGIFEGRPIYRGRRS